LGASEPKPHKGTVTLADAVAAAVSARTFRYPPPSDHSELFRGRLLAPPSSARGIRQWLAVSSGFCLRLCSTLLPAIRRVNQGAIARLPPSLTAQGQQSQEVLHPSKLATNLPRPSLDSIGPGHASFLHRAESVAPPSLETERRRSATGTPDRLLLGAMLSAWCRWLSWPPRGNHGTNPSSPSHYHGGHCVRSLLPGASTARRHPCPIGTAVLEPTSSRPTEMSPRSWTSFFTPLPLKLSEAGST